MNRAVVLLILLVGAPACHPASTAKLPVSDDWEAQTSTLPTDSADSPPIDSADSADSGDAEPLYGEGAPPLVILFVGDGMGFEHVRGAGFWRDGVSGGLFMEQAPHQGRIQTASLSGYTDSAAAATSMATGVKTTNGRLGMDAHGDSIENIVEMARGRGMSVGVVTTDTLTGATPAGFLTHVDSRYSTSDIAAALVAARADVMLGGGRFDLLPLLEDSSLQLLTTELDLALAEPSLARPMVGLFAESTLPYQVADLGTAPSLAKMTERALDKLLLDPEGAFLMVEGARIDHASHNNRTDRVFAEVLAFDAAVQAAVRRTQDLRDREVTILVTADHECGGLTVEERLDGRGLPVSRWRWLDHTNRDVPVFGWGDRAAVFSDQRVHNVWVHAALDAAVRSRDFEEPVVPRIVDGDLDDLGSAVVRQVHESDFQPGYNQLDALRVATDADGLWVGIDGIFDEQANSVVVWLDLDYGAGTGIGVDTTLTDVTGVLDRLLTTLSPTPTLDGLGFDAAMGQLGASFVRSYIYDDLAGVRQFQAPRGLPEDLAWRLSTINFDDGNVADRTPALDGRAPGETEGGMEVFVPWSELWDGGLPTSGASVALFVSLSNTDGSQMSNQALPAYATSAAPSPDAIPVSAVVGLTIDSSGNTVEGPLLIR